VTALTIGRTARKRQGCLPNLARKIKQGAHLAQSLPAKCSRNHTGMPHNCTYAHLYATTYNIGIHTYGCLPNQARQRKQGESLAQSLQAKYNSNHACMPKNYTLKKLYATSCNIGIHTYACLTNQDRHKKQGASLAQSLQAKCSSTQNCMPQNYTQTKL
jgi:hypothetical protein